MRCGRCGFDSPEGFVFCGRCDAPLLPTCPHCGFQNPPGFAFCGKCGKPLGAKDRLTTSDLEHLRTYLPSSLVEALQYELVSPPPSLLKQCVTHLSRLLETMRSHLPAYLVEHIMNNPAPGQAGGQFVHGTLLFADISGFTAMSEQLSRIGREGAEEITSIVNRYFGEMLTILREYGGQLIKFGGDALLGLFVEPDSATFAVQAAMTMQTAMADFCEIKTSLGSFPLRMKVAIHRGRFFAAQLGTQQSMEYALFGSDVNATAAAESAAIAGQVLLDRASYEAISVPCRAAPTEDGYLAVEHIEPSGSVSTAVFVPRSLPFELDASLGGLRRLVEQLDALAPYLPAGLLARIAGDPHATSLEGEHRLVAVLFANVHGLGQVVDRLGPGHEAQIVAALNHYFVAMGNAIHRFGGVINKMDLYDRGDKLLAFFGAPLAHEDDAERAVRAAMAMQEALSEVSCSLPTLVGLPEVCLTQHIGISYGYVFAGYVGANWRHEYTVMGDDVNLSARLMSVAQPGEALVSANVRRKVQALFDLTPRGQVQLKGKSQPTPTFAVAGLRAIPEPLRGLKGMTSPLVGRQAEWDKLRAAIDTLLLKRGQIVSVMGEAGLGKSRLVAEMRQQVKAQSAHGAYPVVQWFEGRCLSYTESVSYSPLQEIVRQMVGIRRDDSEAEAWSKLRKAVEKHFAPDQVHANLPYLATFLNLPLENSLQARVRYLDAEALQRRMFVALHALIQVQTQVAPLILVLEDIHWIDQASQKLIEFLMPLVNRAPLMLLLLYRPERAKICWQIYEKAAREYAHCAVEIALRPLGSAESRELLHNLVRAAHWPLEVHDLILDRTEGNPLYLEELIRALIDERKLVQDDSGQWLISERLEAMQIPDTLQGVMMARLDRLEELSRWTAQVASIVGRIFAFDVLSHIVEENNAQLNVSLAGLQRHEIVRETQRVPELNYAFIHALMQEVCYHSLLARVRRQYHRKIAEHLEAGLAEATGRSEAASAYPLIAHHAFIAQDWPRALRYQLQAGQQARRLGANHGAIDHLEKALQSADNLPPAETVEQRRIIHAALGELLVTTGQYDHAQEHLQAALALAVERGDPDAQARACRWQARLHELRGQYPPAFEWIEQGLAALSGRETTEAAELMLIAGLIHTRQGHYDDALRHGLSSQRIAQQLGEMTVLARAYNLLGHIVRMQGNSAKAIEHFQQAFDLYEGVGDINGQASVRNQIANACFYLGQWREADRHYRQAHEAFSLLGDVYHCALADNNLGGIATNQGRLDEALEFYQSALRSMEQIGGSLWVLGGLHSNLGEVFTRRGDYNAARQHLGTSQQYFDRAGGRDWLPELHRRMAQVALCAGELAEAESQGQQGLGLARELSMKGEEGCNLRVLGEIAAAQGRLDEAEGHLRQSLTLLAEVGDKYETARSYLSQAKLYAAQNRSQDMLAALERCTPTFERLEAAPDLSAARALREAAATQ